MSDPLDLAPSLAANKKTAARRFAEAYYKARGRNVRIVMKAAMVDVTEIGDLPTKQK